MFPERFSNKTNGVTPRRWLRLAKPAARAHDQRTPSETVWVTDLGEAPQAHAARRRRQLSPGLPEGQA